jgi:signal transduction histidine kinase
MMVIIDLYKLCVNRKGQVIPVFGSFVLHAFTYLSFFSSYCKVPAFDTRLYQFLILFALLWFFNVVLIFSGNYITHVIFLSFKILFLVLIGFPLGKDTIIKIFLLTVVLIDFSLFSFPKLSIVFSLLSIVILGMVQRPRVVWNIPMPAPDLIGIFTLVLFGMVIFVLVQTLQYQRRKRQQVEEENRQLFQMIEQLSEANMGFQKYALEISGASILEERSRFSREIHDTIGYTLTNLIIMIEACQDLMKKDQNALSRMLYQAAVIAQDGLSDTRRALHALREIKVGSLHGLDAVQKLVTTFQNSTGIIVEMEYGNFSWGITEDMDLLIYRFIQEGLTNAFRHGKATCISISFWQDANILMIKLRDNGIGSKEIKEGIGISGMKERVYHLQGELYAKNVSQGFELSVILPIRRNKIT